MIKFIDLSTGTVFDGSRPYIHYFDGGQSTNLMYVRRLCVLSDAATLAVSLPDGGEDTVFTLLDLSREVPEEVLDDVAFKDINALKTFSVTSIGSPYQSYYVHMIYVLALSKAEGEVHEMLTINNEQFEVAGDFYNEDERLSINIINKGKDIDKDIQKAFYEGSVHEDAYDNILLNRKFKELLNGYLDIMMKRGSYRSLISSVDFFGYGDLLRLWGFWKVKEVDRDIYRGDGLRQIVDEYIKALLIQAHRTTLTGISCAMETIRENTAGDIVYGDEPVPELDRRVMLWERQDMMLKMSMLGVFLKRYFLPLHIDELHCCVEDIVFADTTKIYTGAIQDRYDYVDDIGALGCSVKDGARYYLGNCKARVFPDTVFGIRYTFREEDEQVVAETDQRILMVGNPKGGEDDMRNLFTIFGIDTDDKEWLFTDNGRSPSHLGEFEIGTARLGIPDGDGQLGVRNFFKQRFEGIGVAVPFHLTFPSLNDGADIFKGTIMIRKGDEIILLTGYDMQVKDKAIDFTLLFEVAGDFTLYMKFDTDDGHSFIHRLTIHIGDETNQEVSIHRIVKRTKEEIAQDFPHGYSSYIGTIPGAVLGKKLILGRSMLGKGSDEKVYETFDFAIESKDGWNPNGYTLSDFMMALTRHNNIVRYRQFLAVNQSAYDKRISTNQCIIIKPGEITVGDETKWIYQVGINIGSDSIGLEDLRIKKDDDGIKTLRSNINTKLKRYLPNYIWFVQLRYDASDITEEGGELMVRTGAKPVPYIVGINSEFTVRRETLKLVSYDSLKVIRNGVTYECRNLNVMFNVKTSALTVTCKDNHTVEVMTENNGWVDVKNLLYRNYIKDNTIRLRVVLGNNIFKEITVTTPDIWCQPSTGWTGRVLDGTRYGRTIKSATCWKETGGEKTKYGDLWLREVFMPFFHKPEKYDKDVIDNQDVICFLPDLTMIKDMEVGDVAWEIRNVSTGDIITPEKAIKQPYLGRYDLRLLPERGYYDIALTWRLTDRAGAIRKYTGSSRFIIR